MGYTTAYLYTCLFFPNHPCSHDATPKFMTELSVLIFAYKSMCSYEIMWSHLLFVCRSSNEGRKYFAVMEAHVHVVHISRVWV